MLNYKFLCKIAILLCSFIVGLSRIDARSIFVNGHDVSSVRSQELKNVNIRIDAQGNVFIDAPQYDVLEQDKYLPLSQYQQNVRKAKHQPKSSLPSELSQRGSDLETEGKAKTEKVDSKGEINSQEPKLPSNKLENIQRPATPSSFIEKDESTPPVK